MNSIAIYLGSAIMNFRHLSQRFIGGEIKDWLGSYHEFFTAIITLSLMLRLAHFLYKNKIFIRL
jgi:hypothetical protein